MPFEIEKLPEATRQDEPAGGYGPAMAIAASVFFMIGFVTVLNDILVPHLKAIFELNYTETMLIQFTFFSAYFLVSIPAAKIISRIGYQRTIVMGLSVMGVGALVFVPAASLPSYGLFLTALCILASGMTLLQVSANPYFAGLGAPGKASSRLTLVHSLNSVGTTIGPWVGGLLILSATTMSSARLRAMSMDELQAHRLLEASSVKLPYICIAVLLALLGFGIARFKLPVLAELEDPTHHKQTGHESIWRYSHLVLGALGIFAYVGAEVSIGSFMVNYLMLPSIAGLTAQSAAKYVSLYWGGAMVGRFAGTAFLRRVPTGPAVGVAAILAGSLVTISILGRGPISTWSILLVGLCNSIMFPSIFSLGIAKLGRLTGEGSGIMIAAIVGGAIIPMLQGVLADRIGLQFAFVLPVVCYLYIMSYGFVGSRPRMTNV
jgi:MFS transporter, FHS family, L-fucose permease